MHYFGTHILASNVHSAKKYSLDKYYLFSQSALLEAGIWSLGHDFQLSSYLLKVPTTHQEYMMRAAQFVPGLTKFDYVSEYL